MGLTYYYQIRTEKAPKAAFMPVSTASLPPLIKLGKGGDEMELVITFIGWQFSMMLARQKKRKRDTRLKLPTDEEIRAMMKEVYRWFREAVKKQREQS